MPAMPEHQLEASQLPNRSNTTDPSTLRRPDPLTMRVVSKRRKRDKPRTWKRSLVGGARD